MKSRSRILPAALLAVVLGGLALFAVNRYLSPAEPRYQGKRLSEWLAAFQPAHYHLPAKGGPRWGAAEEDPRPALSQRDARRAVRALGTNCFPTLFRMLRATDPPLKTKLVGLLQQQHVFKFHYTTAEDLRQEAETAFNILGVRTEAVIPQLLELYEQTNLPDTQVAIASMLSSMGPSAAASAAIPALLKGAASTNLSVAIAATNALGSLRNPPRPLFGYARTPARPDYYYDRGFGRNSDGSLIPELIGLIRQNDPNEYWAEFRLEEIDPDVYNRVVTNLPPPEAPIIAPDSPEPTVTIHDAQVLVVGAWSDRIRGSRYGNLRGRLLVYAAPHFTDHSGEWWGNPLVCLELQDVTGAIVPILTSVYLDVQHGLDFELRDEQGTAIQPDPAIAGIAPQPTWLAVPFGGTIRVRADRSVPATHSPPDGLLLLPGHDTWRIPPGTTNAYHLAATLNSFTNHPNPLQFEAWAGTLKLPPVKIQASKP